MATTSLQRGDLLMLVAVLAAVGVADAAYLTYEWYVPANFCDISPTLNCSKVRASPYAVIGGVPTAVVGLGGFLILLGLAALGLRGVPSLWRWSTDQWLLAFALLGAAIGVVLTLVEIFLIGAICILCVVGFALDLGIVGLAVMLRRAA